MSTARQSKPVVSAANLAASSDAGSNVGTVVPKTKRAAAPVVKTGVAKAPAKQVAASAVKNQPNEKLDQKKKLKQKVKAIRDSFTIPEDEYSQLQALKKRLIKLGEPVKKSELLRAGLLLLQSLQDAQLLAACKAVPRIQTGRPKKS